MFNSETWSSHAEYHINFSNMKARFSSDARCRLHSAYSPAAKKILSLDLDPVRDYMKPLYDERGRPAKNQDVILRSLLLFVLLFFQTAAKASLTAWVTSVLPNDIVLVALAGAASPEGLPPLGSYYDFMNRLWAGSRDRYKRDALFPAGKNSKKPKREIGADGKMADPEQEKYQTRDLKNLIVSGEPLSSNPERLLQDIFYIAAITQSQGFGLIKNEDLTISADGTAVAVHASHLGRRQKGCSSPSCRFHDSCPRHYSDPDADWGHDSHEKTWYFGRTLYMVSCRNNEFKVELPLLMKFLPAKRHDSICFFYAIDEFGRHNLSLSPKNVCLDSAHDNYPTYELLERWDMNALIDINGRSTSYDGLPDDITLDKEAHPHCKAGCPMYKCGYDKVKNAIKYRCPLKCGKVDECPHQAECSPSKYGRTLYLALGGDLRFHPRIPRDSDRYKEIYKERTASERVNDRVLNDYHLLDLMIRGTDHYSFWTMLIGVCIHMDAWYKAGKI